MFEIKTVLYGSLITNISLAILLGLVWWQNRNRYRGISHWLLALLLQTSGILLLLLRETLPSYLSIILANLLIAVGAWILFIGLTLFTRNKSTQVHNIFILLAALITFFYFTYKQPDLSIRTVIGSICIFLLMVQSADLLLRRVNDEMKPATIPSGILLLLFSIVALIRAIYTILNPISSSTKLFQLPSAQILSIFSYDLLIVGLSFTLSIMVARRLQLDVLQRERELKGTDDILRARLRLMEFAGNHSLQELLQATIDEAEKLTNSSIGFHHFLAADQKTITFQTWSTNTIHTMCKAEGQDLHYDVNEAGVWVDCIHERRPVIHNNYLSLQHRKGMPTGHAPVNRELVVPIFRGNKIVSILGVGNKQQDYEQSDILAVSRLADLAWDIFITKQDDERKSKERDNFLKIFAAAPVGLLLMDSDTVITQANRTISDIVLRDPVDIIGQRAGGGVGCIHSLETPQGCGFGRNCSNCTLRKGIESVLAGNPSIHGAEIQLELLINGSLQKRWLSVGAEPIVLDDQHYIVLAIDDITKRKEAEQALRAGEARYRTLFEDSPIVLIEEDFSEIKKYIDHLKASGVQNVPEYIEAHPQEVSQQAALVRITDVNKAAVDWYRANNKNTLQVTLDKMLSPEGYEHFVMEVAALSAGNNIYRISSERQTSKEIQHLIITGRILPGYEDTWKSVLISILDITEREQAVQALRESESIFRRSIEAANAIPYRQVYQISPGSFKIEYDFISDGIQQLSGYSPQEFSNELFDSLILEQNPLDDLAPYSFPEAIAMVRSGKIPYWKCEYLIRARDGKLRWILDTAVEQFDEYGVLKGSIGMLQDITERKLVEEQIKKALDEKETLLRELYHRTKNNMGIINALLGLQASFFDDEQLQKAFEETQYRIRTMALVHQKLYDTNDLSQINLMEYIQDLIQLLLGGYSITPGKVSVTFDMEEVLVLIDTAIPCGLILNELISNILSYAFPGERIGEINVILRRMENGAILIIIKDNGVGLPSGFDPRRDGHMGLQIIFSLAEYQLQANIKLYNDNGVTCELEFKDDLYKPRV